MEQVKIKANDLDFLLLSRKIVETSRGPLWYVSPYLADKEYARYIYNKYVDTYQQQGIPSIQDSMKEHKELGLWSEEKEKQLIKLPEFIDETSQRIAIEKQPSKIKKLKEWLRALERLNTELLMAKNQIFGNSIEFLANDASLSYMVYCCMKDLNLKPLWKSFDAMMNDETSVEYIKELQMIYMDISRPMKEKPLRELARSVEWRIRWKASSEDLGYIFQRDSGDLSVDQFMLVYWSQIYDMAYEAYERPPEEIIFNDELFDDWLRESSKKHAQEVANTFYGKNSSKTKNSKVRDSGELFSLVDGYYDKEGIFRPYTEEEKWKKIEEIRNRNSPMVRAQLAKEEQVLSTKPHLVREEELRKSDTVLGMMGATVTYKK